MATTTTQPKLSNMTWQEAIRAGHILYERWVSTDKKVDLLRVQRVIRQEIEWTAQRPERMTAGCLRECRNDLKQVGSILKHHPHLFRIDPDGRVTRAELQIIATLEAR